MKTLLAVLVGGFMFSLQAELTTYTWVGGSSGNYEDAANWDPQEMPNSNTAELLFTNTAKVVCTVSNRKHAKVTVRSGTTTFATTTASMRLLASSESGTVVYDVAAGAKLVVDSGWAGFNVSLNDVVKSGPGTMECWIAMGESVSQGAKTLDVQGGTIQMANRYGTFYCRDTLTVRSGAKYLAKPLAADRNPRVLPDTTALVVEEGGTFECSNAGGSPLPIDIHSLSGAGSLLLNVGVSTRPAVICTGSFSGTIKGAVKFVAGDYDPFVVEGRNTFKESDVSFENGPAGEKPIVFAPNADGYVVKNPKDFGDYETDAAGNPLYFVIDTTGTTYTHTAEGDDTWPANIKLVGTGTAVEKSGGTWTINNFAMTGGTLELNAGATGTNLVIAGGNSTNVTLKARDKTEYRIDFDGGDHHFNSHITGEKNLVYHQSAGTVWAWPLLATFNSGSETTSYNDVFYTMTGGRLYSSPNSRYSYGLGLEVGGNAEAYLTVGTMNDYHMIACQGSHTLRVKDEGYVFADRLCFANYSGGGVYTARVDLVGGTLEVKDSLYFGTINNCKGRIVFNGGRFLAPESLSLVGGVLTDDQFCTLVGPNGGELRNLRDDSFALTWYGPFISDVPAGTRDGGLVKSGKGIVKLMRDLPVTGPLTVRHGLLRNYGSSPVAPFGAGDLILESGGVSTYDGKAVMSVAAGSGAALVYRNDPVVELGSYGLTAGAIRRVGHGVLFVRRAATDGKLGNGVDFKVSAGVANDPVTGLVAEPVFNYTVRTYGNGWNTSRDGGSIGFLKYDSEKGFVNAEPTAGIPDGTTSASVCEVFNGHADLNRDAAVGAIAVYAPSSKGLTGGLTIAAGRTLTIGNGAGTLAPLVLNNTAMICNQIEGNGKCVVQGGTIDFGAAEGLVLVNAAWRNYYFHESAVLSSRLSGTGDFTFASPWTTINGKQVHAVDVTAANAIAGNVWIEGLSVRIKEPTGLGTGTITVEGHEDFGGRLVLRSDYTGDEFANPLVLSGAGTVVVPGLAGDSGGAMQLPAEDGSLSVLKSVSLTGGIALVKDTVVYVGGGARADVASAITGVGKLEVKGPGTLRLSAANSFAGGIVVREGSTLELAGAGTCGSGKLTVEKGATLRFADRSEIPDGFTFEGEGAVEFGAAPTGDESLVKTGADRQILRARGDYTGATKVLEGTLCLDYPTPAELPCADKISFRLDASDASTLTYDPDTLAVSAWADADGGNSVFAQATAASQPYYDGAAFGGAGAVYFPGTAANRLVNGVAKSFQTVLAVTCAETGDHPVNGSGQGSWANAPLIGIGGAAMVDQAIRMPASSAIANRWSHESWGDGAEIRVNGCDTNGVVFGENEVVSVALASQVMKMTLAIGESYGYYNYSYYGRIGEIVAYTGFLGEEERRMAEKYLMAKWGLIPEKPTVKDMLPPTTELEVAAGATLDLAGTSQTVKSMTLEGEIVNSASATLSVLRLEEGTSYVTGGSLGENIELQVWKDAVLDLGGGTLEVDWVKCTGTAGNLGNIVNGTLIVRKGYRRPYGGSLLIIR